MPLYTLVYISVITSIVVCFSESSHDQIMHRLLRDYDKTVPPSTSVLTWQQLSHMICMYSNASAGYYPRRHIVVSLSGRLYVVCVCMWVCVWESPFFNFYTSRMNQPILTNLKSTFHWWHFQGHGIKGQSQAWILRKQQLLNCWRNLNQNFQKYLP